MRKMIAMSKVWMVVLGMIMGMNVAPGAASDFSSIPTYEMTLVAMDDQKDVEAPATTMMLDALGKAGLYPPFTIKGGDYTYSNVMAYMDVLDALSDNLSERLQTLQGSTGPNLSSVGVGSEECGTLLSVQVGVSLGRLHSGELAELYSSWQGPMSALDSFLEYWTNIAEFEYLMNYFEENNIKPDCE